ncbi:calcium-binding protein [Stappia sp. BW2]|uniref:calcium-binding protein n=1 Tax=Stappia sp. BW2 TaxID=2592622 RepID=UPI0011DEE031|nr:calcium-binding protein [Stappia sp. BW2]TYC68287.1 calcium-binding protein [Stappia sp. BW2]
MKKYVFLFSVFAAAILLIFFYKEYPYRNTEIVVGDHLISLPYGIEFRTPVEKAPMAIARDIWKSATQADDGSSQPAQKQPTVESARVNYEKARKVTILTNQSERSNNADFKWLRSRMFQITLFELTDGEKSSQCRRLDTLSNRVAKGLGKRSEKEYDFPFHIFERKGQVDYLSDEYGVFGSRVTAKCLTSGQNKGLCSFDGVLGQNLGVAGYFGESSIPRDQWFEVPTRLDAYLKTIVSPLYSQQLAVSETQSCAIRQVAASNKKRKVAGLLRNGNKANNTLKGTEYHDIFNGGGGNDILQGLGGSDRYNFWKNDGNDIIMDNSTEGNEIMFLGDYDENKFYRSDRDQDVDQCDLLIKYDNNQQVTIVDWCNLPKVVQDKWTFKTQEIPLPGHY